MTKIFMYITAIAAAAVFSLTSSEAQTVKGTVKTIDTKEFCQKVYDIDAESLKYLGDKPAIVDFYADWCGPCRAIAPTLQELAAQYGDKIVIYKVNIDKDPDLARAFGIRSIPAVLYIPVKGEPKMTVGGRDKSKFEAEIKEHLLND
jgi:thioredoxin